MSTDTFVRPLAAEPRARASAPSAPGENRRSELASFLRSRRERIEPEAVGLPPGLRRRTPGLRREEVAQLAGVGVTWYTWLEQGRQINASVQVLDAVARTLLLDAAEIEHLYRLADVPAVPVVSGCSKLEPEAQQVLDALAPNPASIMNGRSDILAWNTPYALVFPRLVNAPADKRNTLWQVFTAPECCHPFVNRKEELSRMVASFRSRYGRHVNEPAWTEFVKRLIAASPRFAELWETHDVADSNPRTKVFRHPGLGTMNFAASVFELTTMPETRMGVYTPIDDETREKLELVRIGKIPAGTYPCGHDFATCVTGEPAAAAEPASAGARA